MTLSMIFRLGVGIVQNLWWFFFLILLHKFNTGLRSVVYQNKYCIHKYNDFQQSRQTDIFHNVLLGTQAMRVCFMMSKATFNNISVISWWSVLLVEYTKKTTDLSQVSDKLYHIILYRIHLTWAGFETDRNWLHG